jgi:hypothetical protein
LLIRFGMGSKRRLLPEAPDGNRRSLTEYLRPL